MNILFAYVKLQRFNQQTFTPGSPVTSNLVGDQIDIQPLGGAGTAAPSTLIIDRSLRGSIYYSPKPFSATYAALTAVTSSAAPINII